MKKNVGSTEKMIRLVIAIIAIAAYFFAGIAGTTIGYIAIGVGAIALLTGLINFCPLWSVFGINTNKES